jgi:hypothetical protein
MSGRGTGRCNISTAGLLGAAVNCAATEGRVWENSHTYMCLPWLKHLQTALRQRKRGREKMYSKRAVRDPVILWKGGGRGEKVRLC